MTGTSDLEALVHYLRSKQIMAELSEVTREDSSGMDRLETVVRLSEHSIDMIRQGRQVGNYGIPNVLLIFAMTLDKPLAPESRKAASAKSKVVLRGNPLGRPCYHMFGFGGWIVEVKWRGGWTAASLNQDAELSRMLFDYARCDDGPAWRCS